MKNLLLLSNTVSYKSKPLSHAFTEIQQLFSGVKDILFIPYALADHDLYIKLIREALSESGFNIESIHESKDPQRALEEAKGIYIGGGNTFRLLNSLYDLEILETIKGKVSSGVPYLGSSAGSVVAGPTIKTTNDMPIIFPSSFDALNLVEFNINPHYIDPDINSRHMGETRDKRIEEFHEENDVPVIGIREGAFLKISGSKINLLGKGGAKLFKKETDSVELNVDSDITSLID
ncbi:MAG TPA: dipeptidase PepE [bacterium]|nr:dipeptidase PepE [bacterium]